MSDTRRSRAIPATGLQKKIALCADQAVSVAIIPSQFRSERCDFQRQIPSRILNYVRPYVEMLQNGDTQGLVRPPYSIADVFAMTSGTNRENRNTSRDDDFVRGYKPVEGFGVLKKRTDHIDLAKKRLRPSRGRLAGEVAHRRSVWCGSISGLAAEDPSAIVRTLLQSPARWDVSFLARSIC